MGQTGSFTVHAKVRPIFLPYTTWGEERLRAIKLRSEQALSDTFALKRQEFHFLLGKDQIDFYRARDLYEQVFDTKSNKIIDKLEVICAICLISSASTESKVKYLFETFDFHKKGFLTESELFLLFHTVTESSCKIDETLVLPSEDSIQRLVKESLKYNLLNPTLSQLRKPELLSFTATSLEVRAFLEIWRGHASQVLLKPNEMWSDVTFTPQYESIAPSLEWSKLGLPPPSFVKWLRRSQISMGSGALFGHTDRPLSKKTRQLVREGPGAIAEGFLKQGLLADRWILNAIAMLISEPYLIQSLFIPTGQEHQGRYCIRLFEYFSWHNIFIDDSFPVSPDMKPIFSYTSDMQECWLLLLQKAIAKYLGSYGHIGKYSERADGIEMALRWLTGGHVVREPTSTYTWITDEADNLDVKEGCGNGNGNSNSCGVGSSGGWSHVEKLRAEGSIVAFGRSEVLSWMPGIPKISKTKTTANSGSKSSSTQTINNRSETASPHGRLFPVVDVRFDKSTGLRYVILRDAWDSFMPFGNVSNSSSSFDSSTGHCRTFAIKVEDVPIRFDSMYICRLPDQLRNNAVDIGLIPWKTEICSCVSDGVTAPACFMLKVDPDAVEVTAAAVSTATESSENYTTTPPLNQTTSNKPSSNTTTTVNTGASARSYANVLFTISSSLEWGIAGDSRCNPRSRLRIIPTESTRQTYPGYKREPPMEGTGGVYPMKTNTDRDEFIHQRSIKTTNSKIFKSSKSVSMHANMKQINGMNEDTATTSTSSSLSSSLCSEAFKESVAAAKELESQGEFQASSPRCWMSLCVRLLPGTYIVIADCMSSTTPVIVKPARPPRKSSSGHKHHNTHTTDSKKSLFQQYKSSNRRTRPEKHAKTPRHQEEDTPDTAPDDFPMESMAMTMMPHNAPKEDHSTSGSSNSGGRPATYHSEDVLPILDLIRNASLDRVLIDKERWPFIAERQVDVSSRGLCDMVTRLRMEADIVRAELIAVQAKRNEMVNMPSDNDVIITTTGHFNV
eukprot:gene637-1230_t